MNDGGSILGVERLEVVYHQVLTAVQGISLEVGAGRLVALIGTNGAGKTTTLRAISGFIGLDDARVTKGRIVYKGRSIENWPPHRVTRLGIALVPERDKVFESLTVAENLQINTPRRGARQSAARRREIAYEYFPQLAAARNRLAGYLSGGERQMLAIGAALACEPELLLVDELSQGLAPILVEQLSGHLQRIRKELGLSILLVEQNADVALRLADRAYVIESGRIVLDGDAERLRGHRDVQEFYLGGGGARRSYRAVKQYRRSRRWYG